MSYISLDSACREDCVRVPIVPDFGQKAVCRASIIIELGIFHLAWQKKLFLNSMLPRVKSIVNKRTDLPIRFIEMFFSAWQHFVIEFTDDCLFF